MPAYTVPDLPARGAEAFLPAPPPVAVPYGVSSWGLVHTVGAPGTVWESAPDRVAPVVGPWSDPNTQTANVSPNEFPNAPLFPGQDNPAFYKPAIYVASPANMGPQAGAAGINVEHNEDVPVPAINLVPVAIPVQRTPPLTYGRVTPNPRTFPRFRSVLDPPA